MLLLVTHTQPCCWLYISLDFVHLQARRSNMRHRPIGIGVQGLADAFILMRHPYESPEAQLLNIQIFETIYYAALEASCELAAEFGPYETYAGSPVSKGVSDLLMPQIKPAGVFGLSIMILCSRSFNMTCGGKPQQICGTGKL